MRLARGLVLAHFLILSLSPILADDRTEDFNRQFDSRYYEFWKGTVNKGLKFMDSFRSVPESIINVFKKPRNEKEEHGNWNFYSRDILRNVGNEINKIKEKFGFKRDGDTDRKSSEGLDTIKSFFSGMRDNFKKKIAAIAPGTKWCGEGDRADSQDDLGLFAELDKCCRAHDLCPTSIPSGETKYGLRNTGLFTRSICDCDQNFHTCLLDVGSLLAKQIGLTYFNLLGPQCFTRDGNHHHHYKWQDNPRFNIVI